MKTIKVKLNKIFRYLLLSFYIILSPLITLGGSSFDLNIFTQNGEYWNSDSASYILEVQQKEDNWVSLSFINNSDIESVISSIYFSDNFQLINRDNIIINSDDYVNFNVDDKPQEFPSSQNLNPYFNTFVSLDSDNPHPEFGISTGETLNVFLNINTSYETFVNAIEKGDVRIGYHVIGFSDGSSESAVTKVVPEPNTLIFIILGVLCFWVYRIFKFKNEIKIKN